MQSKELQNIIALIPPEFADPAADFNAVRAMFAPFHGHPVSEDFPVVINDYGGVRCGDYTLKGAANTVTAFHCHGGAFVSTGLDEYHFYAEIIARQTGCRVVMPDYRLAPEHPYPAAADDCYHAYRGLLDSGAEPSRIVFMGESCGGSLALGLLVRLRDEGLPLPACFISLTGWFDLSVSGSVAPGNDPFLTPEWVRNRGRDYLGGKLPLEDPLVSCAYADLRDLPPMYLQIGQFDTVREGAIALGANALRAGVAVTVESWPAMVQGWHGLVTADVPEAFAAWSAIRRYIQSICPA
ncbi:Putative acetyl-hydrolase LipR [Halioglobus japonicus]|nr:Putative acetyl-hydrolase LipR [Halioglobus japonicus]